VKPGEHIGDPELGRTLGREVAHGLEQPVPRRCEGAVDLEQGAGGERAYPLGRVRVVEHAGGVVRGERAREHRESGKRPPLLVVEAGFRPLEHRRERLVPFGGTAPGCPQLVEALVEQVGEVGE
jgi:hypothetical protein